MISFGLTDENADIDIENGISNNSSTTKKEYSAFCNKDALYVPDTP